MALIDDGLTIKQRLFAQALPTAKSATEAARIAGYAESDLAEVGSQNLRNSKIMAVATPLIQSAAEQAGVSALWVLKGLKENKERAMQERPVLDRHGNPTGEYIYDGSVANRSLELIGKHLKLFGDEASPDSAAKLLLDELRALSLRARGQVIEGEAREVTAEEQVRLALNPSPTPHDNGESHVSQE